MRNAALLARATLCLVALYLHGSWRLYFGPARWDTFPASRAFAATTMALVMLLYAVDTLGVRSTSVSRLVISTPAFW